VTDFDPTAFLRAVAEHADQHQLADTLTSVNGYSPRIQISRRWQDTSDTNRAAFQRWVRSLRLDENAAIYAHTSNDDVHLSITGPLSGGTVTEVATVITGDDAAVLLKEHSFADGGVRLPLLAADGEKTAVA
jgi:hypothetical protein